MYDLYQLFLFRFLPSAKHDKMRTESCPGFFLVKLGVDMWWPQYKCVYRYIYIYYIYICIHIPQRFQWNRTTIRIIDPHFQMLRPGPRMAREWGEKCWWCWVSSCLQRSKLGTLHQNSLSGTVKSGGNLVNSLLGLLFLPSCLSGKWRQLSGCILEKVSTIGHTDFGRSFMLSTSFWGFFCWEVSEASWMADMDGPKKTAPKNSRNTSVTYCWWKNSCTCLQGRHITYVTYTQVPCT